MDCCWLFIRTLPATTGYTTLDLISPDHPWPCLDNKSIVWPIRWTATLGVRWLVIIDWLMRGLKWYWMDVGRDFFCLCFKDCTLSKVLFQKCSLSARTAKPRAYWIVKELISSFLLKSFVFLQVDFFQFQINFCDYLFIISVFAQPLILHMNTFPNTLGLSNCCPFEFCPKICIDAPLFLYNYIILFTFFCTPWTSVLSS